MWFILGLIAGSIVATIIFYVRIPIGTLKIDRTNPEKDVFRIDIENLHEFKKRTKVLLIVDPNADLSNDSQK